MKAFYRWTLGLVCILLSSPVFAQNAQLSGLVRDSSQAIIPGATVEIENVATHVSWAGRTNNAGLYVAPSLAPGTYILKVQAPGFSPSVTDNLKLDVAGKVSLDVTLQPGGENQTVTVNGGDLPLNTTDATVSTVVDRDFVENIPLNGRSFQSLMSAVPGVVAVPSTGVSSSGELSVNGQRTEANYFTLDGVSVNTGAAAGGAGEGAGFSGSTPGESVLGTTQSIISIDALEEFRGITSTYSAEYGRTPGGQFSFVSRSGTNHIHGSVYDYFRNGAMDANNWFNGYLNDPAEPKQAERQNDFGGTFSGPVRIPGLYNGKDKTFFFFSYEGLRLQSPVAAETYSVPSVPMRNASPASVQAILNAFPLPDDPNLDNGGVATFTSGYSAPGHLNTTSIRVDHSFNDRFKVFGRYGYNPSSTVTRGTDLANLTTTASDVQTITLGATNLIGSRSTNEFRFNLTENTSKADNSFDNFGGATPISVGSMPGLTANDWFGFYFYLGQRVSYAYTPTTSRQRQINVVDGFTSTFGRHTLKWGIDYRRISDSQSVPKFYEWGWAFPGTDTEASVIADNFSDVALYRYTMPVKPIYDNFSAYMQDEWRIDPRLSLSLGVRWDVNPAPGDANGNVPYTVDQIQNLQTTKLAPKGTQLWKTTYGNFAPRVGLAYQVHQQPRYETVLRAGAGLYYDTGNTNASDGYTGIGSVYRYFTSGQFPASQQTVSNVPQPSVSIPYSVLSFGYDPNLKLPRTAEWNVALQQNLGANQSLTLSYVGSAGKKLLFQRSYDLGAIGNPNFIAGSASSLVLTLNGSSSNYDALQVQFQKKISQGLQALLSYTWSHSNDTASSNFQLTELEKADSDFDIRNNFQAAITYDLPSTVSKSWLAVPVKHWSIDSRVIARSALPVDVNDGLTESTVQGESVTFHPDRNLNTPLYRRDPSMPGGRQINPAAYSIATDANGNDIEGNAGRNSARGFDAVQADIAVRREFPITDTLRLQFRAEAFNVLNHAIYGAVNAGLTDSGTDASGRNAFGQAYQTLNNTLGGLNGLYQIGGPRSLQVALKLHF